MFDTRLEQLARYVKLGGLPESVVEELSIPHDVVIMKIRPKINGKRQQMRLMGVLHCNPHSTGARPYKGGLRYHPAVTIDLLKTLALDMTEKCALAELPFGGAKFGVPINPAIYSEEELREITEKVAEKGVLAGLFDPDHYVPGPDVNTNSKTMFWIYNKVAALNAKVRLPNVAAVVTGKPIEYDGCPGRENATAHGLLLLLNKRLELINYLHNFGCPTVAIQGFGNVGMNLAKLLMESDFSQYQLTAVSDVAGGLYNPKGLKVRELIEYHKAHSSFAGYIEQANESGTTQITNNELLCLSVDILIPAAIENQITDTNVNEVQAKMIVEAANEAVTPSAQTFLEQRGIPFIPGIAANTGGAVVSYIEWSRNRGARRHLVDLKEDLEWTKKELKKIMENVIVEISNKSASTRFSLAQSAHVLALEKIAKQLAIKY